MLKLLKDAIGANFLYRNGYLDTLSRERRFSLIGENTFARLKIILITTFKESKLIFIKSDPVDVSGKHICLINSENNYAALKFLKSDQVIFIKFTVLGSEVAGCTKYVLNYKFFFSILFILYLPIILLSKRNRNNLIFLHKAFGLEFLFKKYLKKNRPNNLIFTNDHIPEMRSYILAARDLGVKTIYIQHGSVSPYFPPLIFDQALLESQYSLDTYSGIGISKNTEYNLIGMPKLDHIIKKAVERKNINIIGLAVNQNDEKEKIVELIESLSNKYFIVLRKHPLDNRDFIEGLDSRVKNGNESNVFDFISSIDFLIASDSSIHVEANSLKCRSIYFMMHSNKIKYDYYGYVKNQFIDEVNSIEELKEYIKNFDYPDFDFFSEKLRYYNIALNRNLYGKSTNLIESKLGFIKINNDVEV